MKLLENLGAPSDISDIDAFPWLWAYLTTCDLTKEAYIDALLVDLALAIAKKGEYGIADAGVIEICHRLSMTLDRYLQICVKLCESNPKFLSTRLFSHYLNKGGDDRNAFEHEISRLYSLEEYDELVLLFEKSKTWFDWKTYRRDVLARIANAFSVTNDQDKNFELLKHLVETDPEDKISRNNLSYLALIKRHDAAGQYIRKISQAIAESYVDDSDDDAVVNGVVIDARLQGEAAIVSTLKRFGLCHVRNGANPAVANNILAHIQSIVGQEFPMDFTPYALQQCGELLGFDAASVINAVLPKEGVIDVKACMIRKVDPANAGSFTPFHQDATAFQKAVVNIWTPLTPAGGDYPSMEFVRRRLKSAEDTLPGTDEYNLVRIDEDSIREKFKGEFYEPHDVMPGECIIFLGTTIHRSTMRKGATKTRYSLEIRWS